MSMTDAIIKPDPAPTTPSKIATLNATECARPLRSPLNPPVHLSSGIIASA
jgi:hypothetical protein